jgi:hypothetical protein
MRRYAVGEERKGKKGCFKVVARFHGDDSVITAQTPPIGSQTFAAFQ